LKQEAIESRVLNIGLWGMTKPIFFERLIFLIIPITDTFFLSRISDTAAGAVGMTMPFILLFAEVINALNIGGANTAGQHIGAGNYGKAGRSLAVFFVLIMAIGVGVSVVMFLVTPWLTMLLGMPDVSKVLALFVALSAPHMFFRSVLVMYGRPAWAVYASLLMVVANVALNAVVVLGLFGAPKMGVSSVAFASVTALVLSLALKVYFLHGRLRVKIPYLAAWRFFARFSPPIVKLGVPSFFEPCSYFLSVLVLNGFVSKLGVEAMAARTYTINTFIFCIVVSLSLGTATQVIIAQLIGRRDFDGAHRQLLQSLTHGASAIAGVALLILCFHRPLMNLLTDDERVIQLAWVLFALNALTEIPRGVNIITTFTLRATGDAWFITIAAMIVTWVLILPGAYTAVFVLNWGVIGVFVAILLDESIRACINIGRWRARRWQRRWECPRPYNKPDAAPDLRTTSK
jgi:putative MATE family efflux protein